MQILDNYTANSSFVWDEHSKTVTITGETVDFSAVAEATLKIKDNVTFANASLILPDGGNVYACGNLLKIDENVTVTGVATVYGGDTIAVSSTDVTLLSGTYKAIWGGGNVADVSNDTKLHIAGNVKVYNGTTEGNATTYAVYGGGNQGNVGGNTNIYIGGTVNADLKYKAHKKYSCLYGGCYNGTVTKNTNIVVEENVNFNSIYGAGNGANSKVYGTSQTYFKGNAFSIYGGSAGGMSSDTLLVMESGFAEQVFGGSNEASIEGNTDVRILGGEVSRRIYGGCYNEVGTSGWSTSYYATGHTNVTIDEENTTISLDYTDEDGNKSDNSLYAISRHKNNETNEVGTFIFSNYTDDTILDIIGYTGTGTKNILAGILYFPGSEYDFMVKAYPGGNVYSYDGKLTIVPEDGKTITVTLENGTQYNNITEFDLSQLSSPQIITVEFE